jgi:hypothetical protein
MDDPTDNRLPRLAPLLLVGVLVGLAIVRPGNLAGDTGLTYRLFTTLTAVAVVGYVVWRFHGLIPAAAAIVLLRLADPASPSTAAYFERAGDVAFLITLGIGVAAGSRQGRSGTLPWALIALAAAISSFASSGWSVPATEDLEAHDRLRHVTLSLAVLAVVVGLLTRRATWLDRLRLLGVMIGLPAAALAVARLTTGAWPPLLEGGDWPAVVSEWQAAVRDDTWQNAAWCWTISTVVVPLMLVGLWRTIARGRNDLRLGRPPLAWLLAATAVGSIIAVGARPLASGSLTLAAIGSVLSVFGVADLVLALVERIELKPPEPGPPAVRRVK